jgi:hypothetical protein
LSPLNDDDHVGTAREPAERVLRRPALQVEDDASFAAIDRIEARAVVAGSTGHPPRRVAFGRLHLDHVGAHVA